MNWKFDIIPAIDILEGKCVRLTQGKYDLVEEFSNHPEEIAKKWVDEGASRLHIVDLDGAKEGHPVNREIIKKIISSVKAKVQIGGGIRTLNDIKDCLDYGVSYIVLGTKAFKDSTFLRDVTALYDEKIIIALDLKDNRIALSGWKETSDLEIEKLSRSIKGVRQLIYTDISKDGTLSGPNIENIAYVVQLFKAEIVVSGGISNLENISRLLDLKKKKGFSHISGVILGKSLYKKTIDLKSAIKLAGQYSRSQ